MQIAVISDTHNNIITLEKAVKEINYRGIRHLIHCGDVTFSHMLRRCVDLHIFLAYGNGDLDHRAILEELRSLNPESSAGLVQDFTLDGQRFFVAHGDTIRVIQTALSSSAYDWVLQGHTHRFKDELYGQARWVNPGALGGITAESVSFAVLDTVTKSFERILLKEL